MIAILWTARNGPNPVPQDARTRSPCSSRGRRRNGDAVPRWSASKRTFSDWLPQVGCSTRAARRRGHEGLLLDRYGPDGERYRARHPEMQISTFLVSAAEFERASRCYDLQNPRRRVCGLGTNQAQTSSLRYVIVLSPRLCCGGRVRTGNPPLIESTLLQLSCPLEVPIGHECQLCLVLAI